MEKINVIANRLMERILSRQNKKNWYFLHLFWCKGICPNVITLWYFLLTVIYRPPVDRFESFHSVCFDRLRTRFSFIVTDGNTYQPTRKRREYWYQPVKNKLAAILMFSNVWHCYTWCFLCMAVKYLFSGFCMDPWG